MMWIVNYILEQDEKDVPMILFINETGIGAALEEADSVLEAEYPDKHAIIHSIALAADQTMPHGFIAEDPVGLEPEDINELAWWRKE